MIDYGINTKFLKLPKEGGEPIVFNIKECKRIEDPNYRFNFKKKETHKLPDGREITAEVNAGFRCEFTTQEGGILTINSWAPYYAFSKANVQDGSTIKVSHPAKGEWKVEVMDEKAWDEDK